MCVAFSFTKPYAAKYSPLKKLHSTRTFEVFFFIKLLFNYQEFVLLTLKSILILYRISRNLSESKIIFKAFNYIIS